MGERLVTLDQWFDQTQTPAAAGNQWEHLGQFDTFHAALDRAMLERSAHPEYEVMIPAITDTLKVQLWRRKIAEYVVLPDKKAV